MNSRVPPGGCRPQQQLITFLSVSIRCVTTPPPTTLHSICTVTGHSVIDFSSHLDFVKDLCEYLLLKIESLSVKASFLERRTDVSFLDSVWLTVNTVNMNLEQGGRVVVNGALMDLSSSPLMVGDGVTVSKDHHGVTVVVQDLQITVFFDGYTAHILVEGSTGSSLEGLCKDSSSEARLPGCSSSSCVPLHNYTDDMICPNNTKSCDYLKEPPFTSCDIDRQPYLEACTDLLSRYPAVDGLKCQFLTAYAKACSL
ncbi:uncharacterized protein LOC106511904, partial [Austrofundulus limnaeus]|uniref:Uncharacterized protein LOC106511904 n=1 Tax=Austrofundulus limnaeus TaxID=52670 RepID=A0A2I4AKS3_AUSLI